MIGGRRATLAIAAGSLWLAAPVAASDLDVLLDSASVSRHLHEWPETNAQARERARAALDPEAFALLMREVRDAFAAAALLADVGEGVATALEPAAIALLVDRYAARGAIGLIGPPDGIATADLRDFPGFASQVSRQEVPPGRFALVARLDASTGLARNAWRVSGAIGQAIERGTRALRCEPAAWRGPLPRDGADRSRLVGPFQERVHLELLFLVRQRSDAELGRAVRFLEGPPASALHRAIGEAVTPALDSARQRLRERLAGGVAARCP